MMPEHSCCSHMLINICFSLLTISWWLEDSAKLQGDFLYCFLVPVEAPTNRHTGCWGRGGHTKRRREESLWGSWRAFVTSVTECSGKTVDDEYAPRCALYVSFHADMRRDGHALAEAQYQCYSLGIWGHRRFFCFFQEFGVSRATETICIFSSQI